MTTAPGTDASAALTSARNRLGWLEDESERLSHAIGVAVADGADAAEMLAELAEVRDELQRVGLSLPELQRRYQAARDAEQEQENETMRLRFYRVEAERLRLLAAVERKRRELADAEAQFRAFDLNSDRKSLFNRLIERRVQLRSTPPLSDPDELEAEASALDRLVSGGE